MVRRALTRQTRWYQNRCSIFKIKDFIVQKPFWKILEFWHLVTSFLTWAKKWPKWFRNDFSRAFERRFPFCSTMRRSRDRRGGVQTPPPAGRGKSRGPAGRGLMCCVDKLQTKVEQRCSVGRSWIWECECTMTTYYMTDLFAMFPWIATDGPTIRGRHNLALDI